MSQDLTYFLSREAGQGAFLEEVALLPLPGFLPISLAAPSQPLWAPPVLHVPTHAGAAQRLARPELTNQPAPTHRQVLFGPHSIFL